MANDSSATATAEGFCAVGNAPSAGFVPSPKANCRKAKDPYADLPTPDIGICDYNNRSITSGSVTIHPGIYCGGLTIGQATVHFDPGLYVMKSGDFKITGSNAVITGTDLTIYLYGGNSAVTISGGSEITLVAPTSGPYAGLLFVQHPDAGAGTSSTIMGNSNVKLVGTGYFPTQKLKVGGSGNFGILSPYMAFVADTMEFFGNGKITLNYDAAAAGYNNLTPKAFWGTRLTN